MIDHQTFIKAKQGNWSVVLTPTKAVPKEIFIKIQMVQVIYMTTTYLLFMRQNQ